MSVEKSHLPSKSVAFSIEDLEAASPHPDAPREQGKQALPKAEERCLVPPRNGGKAVRCMYSYHYLILATADISSSDQRASVTSL
jgi:hypothetical protein